MPNEALFSSSVVVLAIGLVLFWLSKLGLGMIKIAIIYYIPIPFVFWLTGLPGIRNKFLVILGVQLIAYFQHKRELPSPEEPADEAV